MTMCPTFFVLQASLQASLPQTHFHVMNLGTIGVPLLPAKSDFSFGCKQNSRIPKQTVQLVQLEDRRPLRRSDRRQLFTTQKGHQHQQSICFRVCAVCAFICFHRDGIYQWLQLMNGNSGCLILFDCLR